MLCDLEIRRPLRNWLIGRGVEPSAIVDEVLLCGGDARADIAVFHDWLMGYEIKSPRDSLARFAGQVECYSRAFEFATLVADADHITGAQSIVRDWWGLIAVEQQGDDACFSVIRDASPNPDIDAYSVASFLWRQEAMDILVALGLFKGCKSKPARFLLAKLVDNVPKQELIPLVRLAIKRRQGWRSASPHMSGDVPRQPPRKSLHHVDLHHLRISQSAYRRR
jgi:hypothetical protein